MSDNLEKIIGLVQPTAISSYTSMDYWCGKLFPARSFQNRNLLEFSKQELQFGAIGE
jgi:hypothetical protein